jgi:hypothetical protein
VYDVTISRHPHCSCPDHAKGNLCKHILFVMLRVLKLSTTNPLVWQKALLTKEVRHCPLANFLFACFVMGCCAQAVHGSATVRSCEFSGCLLKAAVVKLSTTNPLVWQKALLTTEVRLHGCA